MALLDADVLKLGAAILAQTGAGIWWAANTSASLKHIKEQFREMTETMRDGGYARCQVHGQQLVQAETSINELFDRIKELEKEIRK